MPAARLYSGEGLGRASQLFRRSTSWEKLREQDQVNLPREYVHI